MFFTMPADTPVPLFFQDVASRRVRPLGRARVPPTAMHAAHVELERSKKYFFRGTQPIEEDDPMLSLFLSPSSSPLKKRQLSQKKRSPPHVHVCSIAHVK